MNKIPIIVLMGATGSGKSSLALKLAEELPIEIISADSMQVYRGMDIGTAKPTIGEQKSVPHYMIDILDINDRIDIYFYVEKAKQAITSILEKNKIPVLAGGSGLYLKSILYGLDPLPSDPDLRLQLLQEFEGDDNKLIECVKKTDKLAYDKFCDNPRKLLRALEVFYLTKKSITLQQSEWKKQVLKYNVLSYNIKPDRPVLYDKITRRTDKMITDGWIDETEQLINQGLLQTPTAWQAIGYPIIAKFLKNKISFNEMKIRIVAATKKYARRQETWFKHQHPETNVINTDQSSFEKILIDINYPELG